MIAMWQRDVATTSAVTGRKNDHCGALPAADWLFGSLEPERLTR